MRISINWIKEFVDLTNIDIKALIEQFTLSCAEVEEVEELGENTKGIKVAKILEIKNHPNSDHLHLLTLDLGTKQLECICGAPNVKVGMLVAFAGLGSFVDGFEMVKVNIRGIDSIGMCCSGKELGISEENSGILELFDVEPGTDFVEYSGLRDTIFEIDNKSLTNRPDLWCHYGIAREIAALVDRPLKPLDLEDLSQYDNNPKVNVNSVDEEKCYRYSALEISNVTKKVSPLTMQVRLFYCGMRGINLLTDLTNYVMLEVSQPMHAFDKRKVNQISIKQTEESIDFITLDGETRKIGPKELMIYNDNTPVAIAGVMGGKNSETDEDTTSIILESANFDGVAVRKLSQKLSLRTEASIRYEKTLDPEIVKIATARFVKLLKNIDSNVNVSSSYTDLYIKHYDKIVLDVEKAYLDNYIGVDISVERIEKILSSLGFVEYYANGSFHIEVPSYRATKDISRKVDIVEEITRIYGYDNIKPVSSIINLTSVNQNPEHENEIETKKYLANTLGYNEIHSYIWENKSYNEKIGIKTEEYLKIVNSISPENSYIRSTLAPTLLGLVEANKTSDYKMFEIARVATGVDSNNLAIEEKHLCMIVCKRNNAGSLQEIRDDVVKLVLRLTNQIIDFKDTDLDYNWINPKNSANIVIDGKNVGYISSLHPQIKNKIDKKIDLAVVEINFSLLSEVKPLKISYKLVSKFQPVDIDLNFVADEDMVYGEFVKVFNNIDTDINYSYKLGDIYKNEEKLPGKTSYTFNFTIVSDERTLSSEEINTFMQTAIDSCKKIGAELR